MNISSLGNVPNITNQITTGAPQAGFRCDPSAAVRSAGKSAAPGTDISGLGTLKNIDEAARQGYREDFSIRDAAEGLWRKENFNFNIFDPASIQRMQDRVRQGTYTMTPTDAELSSYIDTLRQNGLDGAVDWNGLSHEMKSFQATSAEELEDGLNYMASRYVAALDKLERNYTGDELTAQRAKLEEVYQAGKSGMIDGYTRLLQDNLGLSAGDAQAVRDSFSSILTEKENAYRGALKQVNEAVEQTGPDSVWLKNHDAYIASQLRREYSPVLGAGSHCRRADRPGLPGGDRRCILLRTERGDAGPQPCHGGHEGGDNDLQGAGEWQYGRSAPGQPRPGT